MQALLDYLIHKQYLKNTRSNTSCTSIIRFFYKVRVYKYINKSKASLFMNNIFSSVCGFCLACWLFPPYLVEAAPPELHATGSRRCGRPRVHEGCGNGVVFPCLEQDLGFRQTEPWMEQISAATDGSRGASCTCCLLSSARRLCRLSSSWLTRTASWTSESKSMSTSGHGVDGVDVVVSCARRVLDR